jgi:hypothetical protein
MIVAAVAPEVVVGNALDEYLAAKKSLRKANEIMPVMGREQWTMAHAFFANMGGFILKIKDDRQLKDSDEPKDDKKPTQALESIENNTAGELFEASPRIESANKESKESKTRYLYARLNLESIGK